MDQVGKVLAERGYVVVGRMGPLRVGQILTDLGISDDIPELVGHPFYVTAETDKSDFDEQARVAGWQVDPWGTGRFYRCTTD